MRPSCASVSRAFVSWAFVPPCSVERVRLAQKESCWVSVLSLHVVPDRRAPGNAAFAGTTKEFIRSMQPKHAVDGAQLGRLDQPGMRHGDREQRTVELLLPEGEEILQRRKFRKQIVVLPDVGLQQRGMIRHPIEDLRRRQPVTQDLLPEIVGNTPTNSRDHANLL